jgi:hypothetical protein
MNPESPNESQSNTGSPAAVKISARKSQKVSHRLCQGDILENIEILEGLDVVGDKVTVQRVSFPYVVCLNQECDLERDFDCIPSHVTDARLLHLAIAPAFLFEQFLTGKHWGEIFLQARGQKRADTTIKKIVANEIPRYHYLKFPEADMPELIIDFKHFFTINREVAYSQISKRLGSLDDLFREKINHRFSYYISRIGLPGEGVD